MNTEIKIMLSNAASREDHDALADFETPSHQSLRVTTDTWAADNGCFLGLDRPKFLAMLDKIADQPIAPKFVTVPDVVANHAATCATWFDWIREFQARNLPRAFVLQDGIGDDLNPLEAIAWSTVDALFIGGTTEFKLSPWVKEAVRLANWAGIWVHMGRVNSVKRLRYAMEIGVDSVDGSGISKFGEKRRRMLNFIDRARTGEFNTNHIDDQADRHAWEMAA